jgi:hypothetical protein
MRRKWVQHVAYMDEKPNAYRDLVVMSEGKEPPERSRHKWEDNIKIDL